MILEQEVIEELKLHVPPWTAEKLKKRFMYKTANSTGSPQPDKNGNLDQRYKYAEQYLKILHDYPKILEPLKFLWQRGRVDGSTKGIVDNFRECLIHLLLGGTCAIFSKI